MIRGSVTSAALQLSWINHIWFLAKFFLVRAPKSPPRHAKIWSKSWVMCFLFSRVQCWLPCPATNLTRTTGTLLRSSTTSPRTPPLQVHPAADGPSFLPAEQMLLMLSPWCKAGDATAKTDIVFVAANQNKASGFGLSFSTSGFLFQRRGVTVSRMSRTSLLKGRAVYYQTALLLCLCLGLSLPAIRTPYKA